MIKKATVSGGTTFTGGTVTTVITSTVASGSNFLKSAQGARLSLGSDARYFSDDGSNLVVTGGLVPAADATQSIGANNARFNMAVRDLTDGSVVRWQILTGTYNFYRGAPTDSANAIAHYFDCNAVLSTSGAKIASFVNGAEKCFVDKDGQFEETVAGNGIILKSPDGTRYRLTIANGGTVAIGAA